MSLVLRVSAVAAAFVGAATAAAALLSPVTAYAAPFTLFIYETPAQLSLRDAASPAGQAYWAAWSDYAEALAKAGIVRGGSALVVEGGAITVSPTGDRDGPVAPSGLTLGGYFQIDVIDLAAAADWARKAPVGDGEVSVRTGFAGPTGM
jgi:hypothetical protein